MGLAPDALALDANLESCIFRALIAGYLES
jgi:hypothetical protein